jgi:putative transposase
MIDKTIRDEIPVARQCELLELPRSTAYYKPTGPNAKELELMRVIDEIYTEFPYFGSRQIRRILRTMGWQAGRRRVRRLMRKMGLEALCPKPNLSKPAPGHTIYPYLMKGLSIVRPNQAWCSDITYIRLDGGFVYLVVIMDWFSRKILSWELSNSMDASFCVKALCRAIEQYGPPKVMNTDQGSQFTGEDWIKVLKAHDVSISMDGRGRALDNAFVERFWRSLKYEEVYRREYDSIKDARAHIAVYMDIYNHRRPHSSLDDKTPAQIHDVPEEQAA